MVFEKRIRSAEALGEEPPQATTADFRSLAGESLDGAFRMFLGRLANGFVDSHPVANGGDLTEGDARLHHAEWAGIHAEKHDVLWAFGKALKILLMGFPCVFERFVNPCRGSAKFEWLQLLHEAPGGCDDFLHEQSETGFPRDHQHEERDRQIEQGEEEQAPR